MPERLFEVVFCNMPQHPGAMCDFQSINLADALSTCSDETELEKEGTDKARTVVHTQTNSTHIVFCSQNHYHVKPAVKEDTLCTNRR